MPNLAVPISFVFSPLSGHYSGGFRNPPDYIKLNTQLLEIHNDLVNLDTYMSNLNSVVASGILSNTNFNTGSINANILQPGTITGNLIAPGSITGADIISNSLLGITDANIASNANINPSKINLSLLSHTQIRDIGTNTHPQIDSQLSQLFHDIGSTSGSPLATSLVTTATGLGVGLGLVEGTANNLISFISPGHFQAPYPGPNPALSTTAQTVVGAINELYTGLQTVGASGTAIIGPVPLVSGNSIVTWNGTNALSIKSSPVLVDNTGNINFLNTANIATTATPLTAVYTNNLITPNSLNLTGGIVSISTSGNPVNQILLTSGVNSSVAVVVSGIQELVIDSSGVHVNVLPLFTSTISAPEISGTVTVSGNLKIDNGDLFYDLMPANDFPSNIRSWAIPTQPIIQNGNSGSWDYFADAPSMIRANNQYYVFYNGWPSTEINSKIGVAIGSTLQNLTKYAGNPVLAASASGWDSNWVTGPRLYYENGVYYMFYIGGNNSGYEAPPSSIGVATSTDLINWTKYAGNPILSPGSGGAWDSTQIFRPHVFKWGNTYYLFYNGKNTLEQIGFATAPNLLGPWTKFAGNPVFGPSNTTGNWSPSITSEPYIVRFNNTWAMFYTGGSDGFGVAYSNDLVSWTDDPNNPIQVAISHALGETPGQANLLLKLEIHKLGDKWVAIGTINAVAGIESIYIAELTGMLPGNLSLRTQDAAGLQQTLMDFRNTSGYGIILNSVSQNLQGNDLEFLSQTYAFGAPKTLSQPVLTINPSGSIGIGTNAPITTLDVSGTVIAQNIVNNNFNGVGKPSVAMDISNGYRPGSIWIDTIGTSGYICLNSVIGAAVWKAL